jgi:hypothetical protein
MPRATSGSPSPATIVLSRRSALALMNQSSVVSFGSVCPVSRSWASATYALDMSTSARASSSAVGRPPSLSAAVARASAGSG